MEFKLIEVSAVASERDLESGPLGEAGAIWRGTVVCRYTGLPAC